MTTPANLNGKKAVIFGIANERSLAWAIAQNLKNQGAEIALNYGDPALEKRVRPLAEKLDCKLVLPCNVTNEAQVKEFFEGVEKQWGSVDILIHSVAFANKEDLEGRFINTSREGFQLAMDVSAYSLMSLARHAEPLMEKNGGGSIITMSYYGANKVVPNYNIMGVAKATLEAIVRYLAWDMGSKKITVNAISAGPVKTLAAAGIRNFRSMLSEAAEKTPLKENIDASDVAELSGFLCGPGGKHITGSTLYVDSGYNIMGM